VCNNWFSVDFSGYFIHDLIDIVVNGESSHMWEVIPHHIAVLIDVSISQELTSVDSFYTAA